MNSQSAVLSDLIEATTSGQKTKVVKRESAMKNDNVGEIVATRQLYYFDETNQKRVVSVLVGKPTVAPDSSHYECPFQLIGIGTQETQMARGHDSIQALQAALILVAANLNHLNDRIGRRLVWEGGVKGDLGFP